MGALSCKTLWRQYPGRKILFFFLLQSWYRRVSYTIARQQQYCCLGYHLFSRMPSLCTDVLPPSGKIPTFPEGGGTSVACPVHKPAYNTDLCKAILIKIYGQIMKGLWQKYHTFFLRISMHFAFALDTSPVHSIKASRTSSGLTFPISCEFSGMASSTMTLWIRSYQLVLSQWIGPWGSSMPRTDAMFTSSAEKPSFSPF